MNIDPTALLAIGGPSGVVGAIVVVLIRAYFDARKDSREQQASDVQNDSGIVDNAKKVLELVRNETDRMELRIIELVDENKKLREENKEQGQQINRHEDTIARQGRDIEWLREDLSQARAQIEELRADRGNSSSGATPP